MSKLSNSILTSEASQVLAALGKTLRRARLARGDTQAVAGERIGVHLQTIGRIEKGDPGISAGNLFSLMSVYGMRNRLFDLAQDDEETVILTRRLLPKRGNAKPEKSEKSEKSNKADNPTS